MQKFTGVDLINLGYAPHKAFKDMLAIANAAGELNRVDLDAIYKSQYDASLKIEIPVEVFTDRNCAEALDYIKKFSKGVIKKAMLYPDVCPTGEMPVGCVIASEEIHPEFHSADLCCSVALSDTDLSLQEEFARIKSVTHFGVGGRDDGLFCLNKELQEKILNNYYTKDFLEIAISHLGTQGDGNHFSYVGTYKNKTALVTHHGSRGFGASVYKMAKNEAKDNKGYVKNKVEYWDALNIVKEWTLLNHTVLHGRDLEIFSPHNFVFKLDDGLFYHAKGSTPLLGGIGLVPMNCNYPIWIVKGEGFAPHGAGRNLSRTQYLKTAVVEKTNCEFFLGKADLSENPSAYKDPDDIKRQIVQFELGEIIDEVYPYKSIMAGMK